MGNWANGYPIWVQPGDGVNGACPLNLASLAQSLSVGPHRLKLEVKALIGARR